MLSQADILYMCDGWTKGRGCRIEHQTARQYNMRIIYKDFFSIIQKYNLPDSYKVGAFGLSKGCEGMIARLNTGVIGKILNSNRDQLLLGPEILVNNKICCIERSSIINIQSTVSDLLMDKDVVRFRLDDDKICYFIVDSSRTDDTYKQYMSVLHNNSYKDITVLTYDQFNSDANTIEL